MTAFDEYIARGERFLAGNGDDDAKDLVRLLCAAIASQDPTYKHGLSLYRGAVNGHPRYTDDEARKDVERLVGKMKVLRDAMEHEAAIARLNAAAAGVNLSVNNSNSNVATATANATVTISQAFDALESCSLSPEELSEMKAAIADLEASKGKGPETICEKASKLLDLAKKGADTAKAVAPYVAGALATLGAIL